jgi:hypothetical protein
LEKDRTRRYATANALAHDVERHLLNEPITAAVPNPLYLARKFFRRHRMGLATGVMLLVLLVGGLVVQGQLRWQAEKARKEAEAQQRRMEAVLADFKAQLEEAIAGRDKALQELDKAEALRRASEADRPAADLLKARE